MFSPGLLGYFGQRCRSKHSSRDPFQGVDQGGERYLGRVSDEQVGVVVLEAGFLEFALEVGAYRGPGISKHFEDSLRDDSLPVFRHEDQVCSETKNYMAPGSKVA
jgi:hypothetical protein